MRARVPSRRHPLLLAHAQARHRPVQQRRDPQPLGHLAPGLLDGAPGQARAAGGVQAAGQADVVQHAEVGDEVEHLEDVADLGTPEAVALRARYRRQIAPQHLQTPLAGRQHPGQQ